MRSKDVKLIVSILSLFVVIIGTYYANDILDDNSDKTTEDVSYSISDIPEYSGDYYVVLNDNKPNFKDSEYTTESSEIYSDLDNLGRCGVAYANVGPELMPTTKRGSIGMIKPTGWHTIRYDDLVEGKYLYNRCHLIAYMLTGENANEKNLITCTRHMNATVMLEFENKVADYIHKTGNHVLYRVTPYFKGDNLLATGVQMEASSVEDNTISFNVFVYNVQDGIDIDYATGDSKRK